MQSANQRTALVRMGTKESNVGSVLRRTVERAATQGDCSRLRGYARTLSPQPGGVGAAVPLDLCQVPYHAACQRSRVGGQAGGVLSPRRGCTGTGQGQTLAAADPLGESEWQTETATE